MPKLLCSKDQVEYKIEKNGIHVVEFASFGPYKIIEADEWECPACLHRVVCGFAQVGIHHHSEAFVTAVRSALRDLDLIRFSFEGDSKWATMSRGSLLYVLRQVTERKEVTQ